MKKVLFASVVVFIVLSGFSSCKKCENCTKSASPEIRLCDKDYNNNTEFGLALDGYEAQGYSCR